MLIARRALLIGMIANSPAAWGQTSQPASTQPVASQPAAVVPEIRPLRSNSPPSDPAWVEFTLTNLTDQTVDLGAVSTTCDAALLPDDVLFGNGASSALVVILGDEKLPHAISTAPAPTVTPRPLRIGPYGVLGVRLDLRQHYHGLRYTGDFRLEWKPFNGRFGSATATFRIEPRKLAVIVTDYGKMTFRLNYDETPRNIENFLDLVRDGFYSNKSFHRVVPGFVIQGGCPNGNGTGIRPDGKLVPGELRRLPVDVGTLMMAHKPGDTNSASCQFFIALTRLPDLDGQYTIIGQGADDETRSTLQQISGVATDAKDRPQRPVVIRSVNLIDEADIVPPRTAESRSSP